MVNTINWYVNKKSSKLFIRYRINGKRRDETIVNLQCDGRIRSFEYFDDGTIYKEKEYLDKFF